MININNVLTKIFISFFSVGIFWFLESGFSLRNGDELIKSIIFGTALFGAFTNSLRKYLLVFSIISIGIMIILYLFWQIPFATFFGSIGFGILSIYILSFTPNLIKKGFVE